MVRRYVFFPFALLVLSLLSCRKEPVPRLELVWETDAVFHYPESVVYDPEREILYVSNIGETPEDNPLNGDGFVSILGLNGEPQVLQWISGLNGPKGMDLGDDILWVNDQDTIIEIDLPGGEVRHRYELEGVVGLNDISVGPDGAVFSNDADGHKVLSLTDGSWEVFWADPDEGRPNGVRVEADRILLAMNWAQQLIAMDRQSKEQTLLLDGIGRGDGIESTGDGAYLITDYLGRVIYLSPSGQSSVLMDSRDEKLTADLEYIAESGLVIIPRHRDNTVAAYRLLWD